MTSPLSLHLSVSFSRSLSVFCYCFLVLSCRVCSCYLSRSHSLPLLRRVGLLSQYDICHGGYDMSFDPAAAQAARLNAAGAGQPRYLHVKWQASFPRSLPLSRRASESSDPCVAVFRTPAHQLPNRRRHSPGPQWLRRAWPDARRSLDVLHETLTAQIRLRPSPASPLGYPEVASQLHHGP